MRVLFLVIIAGCTLWGLPYPASGNLRQEYAMHIDEPSVLPRRRAKKRTNQIKRFNLFFMVPLVGTLWGLPYPASGNLRQEYAMHIDEPSVLPRRRAKKRTNQIKRFNSFFMVPLVGTLWGLPHPASGNLRQEYATHIDEPSVLPRRRAKKEQTKSKDLICSIWCRWSGSNRHGIATTGF